MTNRPADHGDDDGDPRVAETLDRALHEATAANRRPAYVERQALFQALDAQVAGAGLPLVVTGEAGVGKTALLANWVGRWQAQQGDRPFVVQHYVGAAVASNDWATMLRRVLGELGRHFDLRLELPDHPIALWRAFATGLREAAAKGRVVLLLDGLDQLDPHGPAQGLAWLPLELPAGVRLIVSAAPGRALDELERRKWPTLAVEPLAVEDRRTLVARVLGAAAEALAPAAFEQLVTAPQAANPLFLRTLLGELRARGLDGANPDRIANYLEAETLPALYERVFARWENDYEGDTDLVGDTLSLLVSSRRGLSEDELLALLGSEGVALPRAQLAPLLAAATEVVSSRAGLLDFAHPLARHAAAEAYVPAQEGRQRCHRRLVAYFAGQPLSPRKLDELPWQLAHAGDWQGLYALLADEKVLEAMWRTDPFAVRMRWAEVEHHDPGRMTEAYAPIIRGERGACELDQMVGMLLANAGHLDEALAISRRLAEQARAAGDAKAHFAHTGQQAAILRSRGRGDEAMALLEEQARLCRERSDQAGLQVSLGNQATLRFDAGQLEQALGLRREQERICRASGDDAGLQASLSGQARIAATQGRLDEAVALLEAQERICRGSGNTEGLLANLDIRGRIALARGQADQGLALAQEQRRLASQVGDLAGLQRGLSTEAMVLTMRGKLDEAMVLLEEQERICRQLGHLDALLESLGNQANILRSRGDLQAAMDLFDEVEQLCRRTENQPALVLVLNNKASLLAQAGQLDDAMALLVAQEQLARQLDSPEGLASALANQAVVLVGLGRASEVTGRLDEAMAIAQQKRLGALIQQISAIRANLKT